MCAPETKAGRDTAVRVDDFRIERHPSGDVAQFQSDVTLLDTSAGGGGRELLRETMSVNHPLRYGGLTLYQADWAMSSLQFRVTYNAGDGGAAFGSDAVAGAGTPDGETLPPPPAFTLSLPMESLKGRPGIQVCSLLHSCACDVWQMYEGCEGNCLTL